MVSIGFLMIRNLLFSVPLFFCAMGFSQVQRDTAFTEQSELGKVSKIFPFVKLAKVAPDSSVKEISDIPFKVSNGRNLLLNGFFVNTKNKKPAVILIHGGGWKSGSKEMMASIARKLSQNGYHCFAVEYRLSGEARYPAAIEDVKDAIGFIKKNSRKYKVDRQKIAVLGTSSGGQIAALIGGKYPELVNVVVDIDGILAFHHPLSKEASSAANWLGGTFEQIPEIWNDASPLTHADKISVPYLFINSQFDRFHAGRDELVEAMSRKNIPAEVRQIQNSPHTFWMFKPWFQPTIDFVIEFLNKHNSIPTTFKQNKNENR